MAFGFFIFQEITACFLRVRFLVNVFRVVPLPTNDIRPWCCNNSSPPYNPLWTDTWGPFWSSTALAISAQSRTKIKGTPLATKHHHYRCPVPTDWISGDEINVRRTSILILYMRSTDYSSCIPIIKHIVRKIKDQFGFDIYTPTVLTFPSGVAQKKMLLWEGSSNRTHHLSYGTRGIVYQVKTNSASIAKIFSYFVPSVSFRLFPPSPSHRVVYSAYCITMIYFSSISCVVVLCAQSSYFSRRKNRRGHWVYCMSTGRKNGSMWRNTNINRHGG